MTGPYLFYSLQWPRTNLLCSFWTSNAPDLDPMTSLIVPSLGLPFCLKLHRRKGCLSEAKLFILSGWPVNWHHIQMQSQPRCHALENATSFKESLSTLEMGDTPNSNCLLCEKGNIEERKPWTYTSPPHNSHYPAHIAGTLNTAANKHQLVHLVCTTYPEWFPFSKPFKISK